ncbi:hydrogenase maturation nickel metallochaperone HypA [Azomonas macrocytogenes]|uniref:Hydrogenase maturation factor HypA n=1 Tax=Azomonas macrocytogenes TaxID=69962 RepID=A0A839T7J2_AZOMA|nr:hydrogenase maturation nickel metallochaperone HypA [Azomonas macrocytogenes]MBB3104820.1 hydrogenase nickel incorporation protein HypA/HybF [Azomonas macrocytogenes]
MHEMSIAEGVVQLLEEQATAQRFSRVKTVWLEIGPLAMIEQQALRFCFEAVTRNTLAQDARLEIIDLPGQAWCLGCNASVPIRQRYDACPACGSHHLQVTQGDEMRVKELEVE